MTSFRLLCVLLVAALLQCATVFAVPAPQLLPVDLANAQVNCTTNAECLRRGLPLLPATRSRARRDVVPVQSQLPSSYIYPFRLAIHQNGARVFYLRESTWGGEYYIGLTTDPAQAMILGTNVAPSAPSSGGINFRVVNAPSPGYQWFGMAAATSNSGNLSPTSNTNQQGYTHISNTQTTSNSRPVSASLYNGGAGARAEYWESAAWYLDSATNVITPIYTNANPAVYGATTTLTPLLYNNNNFIFLVPNPTYWSASGVPATFVMERF